MSKVTTLNTLLVAGILSLVFLNGRQIQAAEPADYLSRVSINPILRASDPPGSVGQARLMGRGPVVGYYQPVAVTGPEGVHFSLPAGGGMTESTPRLEAGFLIGSVYRFQVTRIPGALGAELFPTVEVIDRTYPPQHLATRYPIEIQLDIEDFRTAINGQMVTRVIYLEDPQTAVPEVQKASTNVPLEISEFQDPLAVADEYGRPVAIVRIGSLTPPNQSALLPEFFSTRMAELSFLKPSPTTPKYAIPLETISFTTCSCGSTFQEELHSSAFWLMWVLFVQPTPWLELFIQERRLGVVL